MTIEHLSVGGVPEHFNFPWLMADRMGLFAAKGVCVKFVECPGGTGQLVSGLKDETLDVAMALCEGLVSDVLKGSDVQLLGTYVQTPLCWAISTSPESAITSVDDLRGKTFGVSRLGSGSHLMAIAMATVKGWNPDDLKFVVEKDFKGLRESVRSGRSDAFLWETFTTKPWHDNGELGRVGEIYTAWPAFLAATRKPTLDSRADAINRAFEAVREALVAFRSDPTMAAQIAEHFKLLPEDAAKWYSAVRIVASPELDAGALEAAVQMLRDGGAAEPSDEAGLPAAVRAACAGAVLRERPDASATLPQCRVVDKVDV